MSEQKTTAGLQVEDLTKQAEVLMKPFNYAKMSATSHHDTDGVLTQSQIVGSRHRRLDNGGWPEFKKTRGDP
jgi:hypothetical protein